MDNKNRGWGNAGQVLLAWCAATAVHAQAAPDAGSLLRETQRDIAPPAVKPPPSVSLPSAPPPPIPGNATRFTVHRFVLEGAGWVPDAELQPLLAAWLDRPIGFADLERAAQAIVDEYRRRDRLARVELPPQDITDGRVRFRVIEARLGAVRMAESTTPSRVRLEYLAGLLTARQQPGEPLRLDAVDRAINLLNDTPGVSAAVALSPGQGSGETDLVVSASDRPLWANAVQADDLGARSTGAARLALSTTLDDPSGRGDQAALGTAFTEGSSFLQTGYTLRAGGDGARVGVNASAMQYRLVGDFAALQARGEAQTLALTASYPLVRGTARNLTLGASVDAREYRDKAGGVQTDRKTVHAATVTLGGDASDAFDGLGGYTLWGVAATFGRLDLAGDAASAAADQAGPRTEGSYGKVGFNLARLQHLGPSTALWAVLSGQAASRNLDSSEKFSLGGAYGVRAYPALEAQGDSGWLGTLELRQDLLAACQLFAFVDAGGVQRSHSADHAGAPAINRVMLAGAGFGLNWSRPGDFSLRASVATRLGDNPLANPVSGADSDGSHQRVRVWLVASKLL